MQLLQSRNMYVSLYKTNFQRAKMFFSLTFWCLVSTKRLYVLKQAFSVHLLVCLSMSDLLVDTRHQSVPIFNKISQLK